MFFLIICYCVANIYLICIIGNILDNNLLVWSLSVDHLRRSIVSDRLYTPRFRFAPSWRYKMATSATLSAVCTHQVRHIPY